MRQTPKTVAVFFAPHSQQVAILDVSASRFCVRHATAGPRMLTFPPAMVIAAATLYGLLSFYMR
jgi:hypothetical protein